MSVDGFSEAIWHFIGYVRIADTTLRGETLYLGDPAARQADDPYPGLFSRVQRPEFEDLDSRRLVFNETTSPDALIRVGKLAPQAVEGPRIMLPHNVPRPAETHPLPDFDEGLPGYGYSIQRLITVEYESGGTETLLNVHQVNHIDDRDAITTDLVRDAQGRVLQLPELDVGPAMVQMTKEAVEAGHAPLPVEAAQNTESLLAAIDRLDARWAQTGHLSAETPDSAPPAGRIVDGQTSTEALVTPGLDEIMPWRPLITQDEALTSKTLTGVGPSAPAGVTAITGQNSHVNDAGIVDVNEASGSMIVGGDSYFSRGIVQVNVLTDSDHVEITAGDPLQAVLATHGNEVHNVAEFVNHEMTATYKGAAGTALWHVDVLQGNFYDIKTVVQFNGIDDSDRVIQANSGTYFEASTGLNAQANLTRVTNLDNYDVIVIRGDYHRADWIYQYNIVYDCDTATLAALGGDDTPDADIRATTGFHQLTNTASITTYDSAGYQPLSDAHRQLISDLADGVTILKPSGEWKLAGNSSGTLNVLFVDGDYFDVNTITQFNVIADADQSLQISKSGGLIGAATGGNSAQNFAQIIDPGTLSASKYLGGQTYDAAVLVQANIVTDSDTVVFHDTHTLAPELVAFMPDVDVPPSSSEPVAPRTADVSHHDVLI